MAGQYSVAGLRLETSVALNACPLSSGEQPDTWVQTLPLSRVPQHCPEGDLWKKVKVGRHSSFFVRNSAGYQYRLGGALDCWITPDAVDVRLSVDQRLGSAFESVYLSSGVTSLVATLRGCAVLHAGAVRWAGHTVAIAGNGGQGKTTLLTLLCAGGAELLTEDALRIESRDGVCWGYSGTQELRLRPQAARLSDRFESSKVSDSCDGRRVVIPSCVTERRLPIEAFVVPCPSPGARELRLEVQERSRAVSELARYPRVLVSDVGEYRSRRFREVAKAARAVPVILAHVPWGPPFPEGIAAEFWDRIADVLRAAHRRASRTVADKPCARGATLLQSVEVSENSRS